MFALNRFRIKVGGESGQGINSVGEILAKTLKNSGFKVFAYREYPSLIKGGFACYQIDVAQKLIYSSSQKCDLLICLSRLSVHKYLKDLALNGTLVHTLEEMQFQQEEQRFIEENNINVIYLNAEQESLLAGGNKLTSNVVLTGFAARLISLSYKNVETVVLETFAKKKEFIEINKNCLERGFKHDLAVLNLMNFTLKPQKKWIDSYLIDGNDALAMGAIHAGLRAYFGYPMTPSTSILGFISNTSKETGVLVKQAEDEITAAQMTLGAMFTGTRAMTATSGGGFDLMSETLSLSGITETPFVCVIAQRPGPATGLPTWTAASDLNLAIFAGHGEFPRIVIAVSDPVSAFERIQQAFYLAEQFQVPVLVLTEKQIAEGLYNIGSIGKSFEVQRGLISEEVLAKKDHGERYEFTESGISPRWLPGQSDKTYNGNSDEHNRVGDSIEDSQTTKEQVEKRMRKLTTIEAHLPDPELYGSSGAKTTVIGWGSVKNVMLDFLSLVDKTEFRDQVNYLHYEYLWPFKTEKLVNLAMAGNNLLLIENNYTGQLGRLIRSETGLDIEDKLLKYDGRPFFIEEILDYLKM